jgi:hypothetical protein
MPIPRGKRAASVELGERDFAVKYNKNGRPVRKSTGQKFSPNPGYVDSSAIDQQLLEIVGDDLSDLESDFDSEAEREALKKKSKKRKRTPSPTPPPLSPLPLPDIPSERSSPKPCNLDADTPTHSIEPIHLTFNIEKGFTGPLHVQLDVSQIFRAQKCGRQYSAPNLTSATSSRKVKSKASNTHKKGFLSLPPGKYCSGHFCARSFQLTKSRAAERSVSTSLQDREED